MQETTSYQDNNYRVNISINTQDISPNRMPIVSCSLLCCRSFYTVSAKFIIYSGGVIISDPLTYTRNNLNIRPVSDFSYFKLLKNMKQIFRLAVCKKRDAT
jgi:hypothetical protein